MRILLTLGLSSFLLSILACSELGRANSESISESNVRGSNANTAVGSGLLPGARTPVSTNIEKVDAKNCINKRGWSVPPSRNRIISDTTVDSMQSRSGSVAKVTSTHFAYSIPWSHLLEYRCKDEPAYLRGQMETPWFVQLSVNGKVFMYSIFAKQKKLARPSNNDPGEERFIYQIMDNDGDGLFETLIMSEAEVVVPEWALS